MRISTKEPFVIRFDGKQITKNKDINLMDRYNGSFLDSLEKTAKYFSNKYHCYAVFGSDEISFIVLDPFLVIEDLEPSDKTTHSHELIALFSQYFFDYFNHFDTQKKIFWHGKCFSIPKGKIISYIKYRTGIIKNVMITYFLKKNNVNNDEKLTKKEEMATTLPGYLEFRQIQDGILYYDGQRLDLYEFLNNETLKVIEEHTDKEANIMFNVDDIDIEML